MQLLSLSWTVMVSVRGMPVCVSLPSRFERISERSKPVALSSTKYGPISPSGVTAQVEESVLVVVAEVLLVLDVVLVVDAVVSSEPPPQLNSAPALAAPPIASSALRRVM